MKNLIVLVICLFSFSASAFEYELEHGEVVLECEEGKNGREGIVRFVLSDQFHVRRIITEDEVIQCYQFMSGEVTARERVDILNYKLNTEALSEETKFRYQSLIKMYSNMGVHCDDDKENNRRHAAFNQETRTLIEYSRPRGPLLTNTSGKIMETGECTEVLNF